MSYTIASILPRAAARLNDPNQTIFTNTALLPFAQDAADQLQLELELNGILVLEKISTTIVLPILPNPQPGTVQDLGSLGLLPTDMLEPQRIEERLSDSTDLFMPMIRRQWEPDILVTDSLRYWTYREENIFFVGATTVRDLRIYYLKRLINVTSPGDTIAANNTQMYMITQIASFGARYIGENPTRADELEEEAAGDLSKVIRIGTKSKQGTRTRRRPFVITGRRRWV